MLFITPPLAKLRGQDCLFRKKCVKIRKGTANESQKILIGNLKKLLKKERRVLFGYLFGSRASPDYSPRSDVDVALYFDASKVKNFFEERIELINKISRALKKEADVIVLNNASPFLKYVVLKEGKLVFEKNKGKRVDFELKSLNEYFDYKPILEMYNQKLLSTSK